MHDEWHVERAVAAIRSAAQDPLKPEVADALAAAIASQQARAWMHGWRPRSVDGRRWRPNIKHRQEEEPVIFGLQVELRVLCATDPGMSLLTAVEYITPDPAHSVALYRRCSSENRVRSSGMGGDDPRLLTIASSVAKDLALLERRARAEGFQV
jgi:hypothetical protein